MKKHKFGAPKVRLRDQRVCATGVIPTYHGAAEIIVRERSQLRLK